MRLSSLLPRTVGPNLFVSLLSAHFHTCTGQPSQKCTYRVYCSLPWAGTYRFDSSGQTTACIRLLFLIIEYFELIGRVNVLLGYTLSTYDTDEKNFKIKLTSSTLSLSSLSTEGRRAWQQNGVNAIDPKLCMPSFFYNNIRLQIGL
jgi:hypothetical protein